MRNLAFMTMIAFAVPLEWVSSAFAMDNFKLLDLDLGNQRVSGRVLTHDDQWCWLLGRDGRLQQLPIKAVKTFKESPDRFRPHSHSEFKDQLKVEFGESFEVYASKHFVVVSRFGLGGEYASIFELIYRDFVRSFRARGFHLDEPEFPMVAIVFPDEDGFVKYCQDERTRVPPGVVGFYLSTSNRVAMYESPNIADVDDTVIHEATYQIAFNTGIHSRLGKHPRWVVEGLATVFEAEGVRSRQGTTSPADRINRGHYLWFREYAKARRAKQSLAEFLRDDQLFEKSIRDAYSEAWAISFFLIETRSSQYSKYLKQLVDRDPLAPYESEERLQDFMAVFGDDINALEVSFLRFIKRISD